RSVFAPALNEDWTQEEMQGVSLGDERLNQRAQRMLRQRWARPTQSFCRSFDNLAEAKGAYGLLENPRIEINLASLLAPHQQQTARRMAAESWVLLAQATTGLSYSTLHQTTGLGPLGEGHSRGLFLHSLQAFRLDGLPLGNAGASLAHGQAGAALARGGDEPAGGSAQKELAGTQALRSLGPRAGSPRGNRASGLASVKHLADQNSQDGPQVGALVFFAMEY